MKNTRKVRRLLLFVAVFAVALAPTVARAGAVIKTVNNDGPNEGSNDPTPTAPVGGNTGTTLGRHAIPKDVVLRVNLAAVGRAMARRRQTSVSPLAALCLTH